MQQDPHMAPDAFEKMLRKYMLYKDPKGVEGESLLEKGFQQATQHPTLPSAEKEASLISQLKKDFITPPSAPLLTAAAKWGLLGVGVSIVATLSYILFFTPEAKTIKATPPSPSTEVERKVPPIEEDENLSRQIPTDEIPYLPKSIFKKEKQGHRYTQQENLFNQLNPEKISGEKPPLVPEINNANAFPQEELYRLSTVSSHFYVYKSDHDTLILTPKGSILHLPAHAFTNQNGEIIKSDIQVEIKELSSPSEHLLSNVLSASENGRNFHVLSSFHLQAKHNGELLRLAPGKTIYLEPATHQETGRNLLQAKTGDPLGRGYFNWQNAINATHNMIPIPSGRLYFEAFQCRDHRHERWNVILAQLAHEDFSDTWVATREFRARLKAAFDFQHLAYILETYRDHTHLPLHQADMKVLLKLRKDRNAYPNKGIYLEKWRNFVREGYTYPLKSDPRGVDLFSSNADLKLLRGYGLQEPEVDNIFRIHKLGCYFSGTTANNYHKPAPLPRDWETLQRVLPTLTKQLDPRPGFYLSQTGWVQIGYPVSEKNNKEELEVIAEVPAHFGPTQIFVSYGNPSVLQYNIGSTFAFRSLPKGENAWIIGIAYHEGVPYLGLKKIVLGESKQIKLALSPSNIDDFIQHIKAID